MGRCLVYRKLDWVVWKLRSSLQWRHNGHNCVSIHQPHDCLLRSKKTSRLCVTGLCEENSPMTGEFPTQRASNVENVSICWRHLDWTITIDELSALHCEKIVVRLKHISVPPYSFHNTLIDKDSIGGFSMPENSIYHANLDYLSAEAIRFSKQLLYL